MESGVRMMCWNGDWGWGAWTMMAAGMVVFWGLVALVLVVALRTFARRFSRDAPEAILAERLARGEITAERYEELRRVLRT